MCRIFLDLELQNLPNTTHDFEVADVAQTGQKYLVLSKISFTKCDQKVQQQKLCGFLSLNFPLKHIHTVNELFALVGCLFFESYFSQNGLDSQEEIYRIILVRKIVVENCLNKSVTLISNEFSQKFKTDKKKSFVSGIKVTSFKEV